MKNTILFFAATLFSFAADQPKAETPSISAELRAKFWRTQAERIAADTQAQKAGAAFESAVADMKKACGTLDLSMSREGEPICVAKAEPEKPASTK